MPKKIKRIILVGGGTGGHIYPLISISKALSEKIKCKFLFLGDGSKVERSILTYEGMKNKRILSGKLRRDISPGSILRNFFGFFLSFAGIIQSFSILRSYKPDIIISRSGYISVPVCLAARILKINFILHESDVTPSLTTRICSKFSHAILTAFPIGIYPLWVRKKAIYTGLPIREDFKKIRQLSEDYILIMGGSSGALSLNSKIFEILEKLVSKHKVIHLTGRNETRAKDFKNKLGKKFAGNYEYYEYRADMANFLKNAKLVISRSGATSIFEIAALGKKAIFVPISQSIAPHQKDNADLLESLNLATTVSDSDTSSDLLKAINDLIEKKQDRKISAIYFPDSDKYIADLVIDFLEYFKVKKLKKIFMIGIGGVSMKGLAEILISMGIQVRGSDLKTGGHKSSNINLSYDEVIYSSAANAHSQARVEHNMAKKLKIKLFKRSQMIGSLMGGYRGISIAGMHGKTTVSSILSNILVRAKLDPTFLIGAPSKKNSSSHHLGGGIDFVSEACEYDGSFLDFKTKIAVITNIEEEHLDYFKGGLKQILKAFELFINNIYSGGLLVYCADDRNTATLVERNRKILINKKIKILSYGFNSSADAKVSCYQVQNGVCSFKIDQDEFSISKTGKHVALNCAASYCVARFLGVNPDDISQSIQNYEGASRRFEFLGQKDGVMVYDDYGHHPSEIEVTLQALSEVHPKQRKILIYQPHQQKRFDDFYEKFAKAFKDSKIEIIGLMPVFKVAGRDEKPQKTSEGLVSYLKDNKRFFYINNYKDAEDFIRKNASGNDVVMTMGATDVNKVAEAYLGD
ncbi:MAG: glycosyltransferase [bacterium]